MTVIGHNHIRKVESFDNFEILAHPLPKYDDRSIGGVNYGSHDVRIARPLRSDGTIEQTRLAILMHNGAGRFVLEFFESKLPVSAALLMLPEREQYALAHHLFRQADECASGARAATTTEWAQAFVDGRIRKRRRSGSLRVSIESVEDKAARTRAPIAAC